jgi:4-amino-4-deoxy-L-arabinose transferase-like glycosyltransferase
MALAVSLAALLAVMLFTFVATALGHRLLRLFPFEIAFLPEHLLCSAALGVICTEVCLFLSLLSGNVRIGVVVVVVMILLLTFSEFKVVSLKLTQVVRSILNGSRLDKTLASLAGLVLLIEGLAAMAPLTGSDALHYHFTSPLLILRSGFHPDFFLSHSFFCGQSHLLILLGLAFGSSQFAMGLIFLGGFLTAAACACLVRRWTSGPWKWIAALVFLLTPVVIWQISAAGAPDLWMAFFATTGVLIISRAKELPRSAHAILAGALAGGIAGTKYTGCIIAASMAVAFFWEVRSAIGGLFFFSGSLGAGIWPYARNFVWTGDPMFPFMTRWLTPEIVNVYALASYRADTGAGAHNNPWMLLKFLFFAGIDSQHMGFWQFLGPIVVAFAPLLIFAVRRDGTWRTVLFVWVLSALGIGWTSGMTRFLLPILPIALAAVLAGAAHLSVVGWRAARFVSLATIASFLLFGTAGLFYYNRSALAAATGLISCEDYLQARAPEYEKVRFINEVLAGKESEGKTLVFLRHVYYLRVPFVYGDPGASWAIDPAQLQTAEAWQRQFREQDIRWVVRAPEYPAEIASPLLELEAEGQLEPIAETTVQDFQGMRISGNRQSLPLVILEVKR